MPLQPPVQHTYYQQYQQLSSQGQFITQNQHSLHQHNQFNQPLYYCWNHGVTTSPAHTSINCRTPAPGHQAHTTYFNQMDSNSYNSRYCRQVSYQKENIQSNKSAPVAQEHTNSLPWLSNVKTQTTSYATESALYNKLVPVHQLRSINTYLPNQHIITNLTTNNNYFHLLSNAHNHSTEEMDSTSFVDSGTLCHYFKVNALLHYVRGVNDRVLVTLLNNDNMFSTRRGFLPIQGLTRTAIDKQILSQA